MKSMKVALITIILLAGVIIPAGAVDDSDEALPGDKSSHVREKDTRSGGLFRLTQNGPNRSLHDIREIEESEEDIKEQFLDSYYHNEPFPESGNHWIRVRLMIMWRLVEYLDIDEDTAGVFFPLYSSYLAGRGELMNEQRMLTRMISDAIDDESADVTELKLRAERLTEIEQQLVDLHRELLVDSKGRLTERQYVKLYVFDEQLKNDLVRRILRDGRERGPGDRPGGPPPESSR